MARRSTLRASDLDRERVAERLRDATAEGRLLASELEDRLGAVFSSRTYGELDPLVADLPAPVVRRPPMPLWARGAMVLATVLAVLAVLAMVALLILGLAGAWIVWMVVMWLWLGRAGRGRRAMQGGRIRRVGCSWSSARCGGIRSSAARSPRDGPAAL